MRASLYLAACSDVSRRRVMAQSDCAALASAIHILQLSLMVLLRPRSNGRLPAAGGQWQVALPIFYSMQLMGLRRDGITYCSTISALAKGNQAARAVEVRHSCSIHPMTPLTSRGGLTQCCGAAAIRPATLSNVNINGTKPCRVQELAI